MKTSQVKFHFLPLCIILCLLSSCTNRIKDEIQKWQGKQLILPDNHLMINPGRYSIDPLKKRLKILTLVNANCGKCVEELTDWKRFISQVDTGHVGFIFLCHSQDELMLLKRTDSLIIKLSYPYFQDPDKKLISRNSFSDDVRYQTFLLDTENKVILIGNPIYHAQIRNLYLKEIQERLNTADTGNGVRFIDEPGRVRIQVDGNIIFKDDEGKILSKKEMKEKAGSGKYILDHNSNTNTITLKEIK